MLTLEETTASDPIAGMSKYQPQGGFRHGRPQGARGRGGQPQGGLRRAPRPQAGMRHGQPQCGIRHGQPQCGIRHAP